MMIFANLQYPIAHILGCESLAFFVFSLFRLPTTAMSSGLGYYFFLSVAFVYLYMIAAIFAILSFYLFFSIFNLDDADWIAEPQFWT